MAEDFLPVGIRATVVGVTQFLSDLRKMQKGVADFGAHVRDTGVDLSIFSDQARLTTEASRNLTAQTRALVATTKEVSKAVSSSATSVGKLNTKLAAVGSKATVAKSAMATLRAETTGGRVSLSQYARALQGSLAAYAQSNSATLKLRQNLSVLRAKYTELEGGLAKSTARFNNASAVVERHREAIRKTSIARTEARRNILQYEDVLEELIPHYRKLNDLNARSADELAELRAEIVEVSRAHTDEINKLAATERAMARLEHRYGRASQVLAGWTSRLGQQRGQLKNLAGAVAGARTSVAALGTAFAVAGGAIGVAAIAIKGVEVAIKAIGKAASIATTAIKGIGGAVGLANRGFSASIGVLKSVNGWLFKVSNRAFRVGNSIRFLGTSITFLISLPIIGTLRSMSNAAIDFEEAWAGVIRTADDPALGEFFTLIEPGSSDINDLTAAGENLRQGIRNLALDIPIAAVELAKLGEVAGTLGIRGNNNLISFIETTARLGVTTNISSEEAATGLAKIIGIAGGLTDAELAVQGFTQAEVEQLTTSEKFQASVESLGGVLVDLGNKTRAQEDEIVNFANKIAGASNIVGLSTREILAFAAAFQAVGVDTARGGTAFQKTIVNMLRAVEEGGKKLEIFAATAGETADDFVQLFRRDAAGAITQFIEGLGQAGTQGVAILDELQLADARVFASIQSLASAEGELTKTLGLTNAELKNQADGLNALLIESERRFSTTKNQIQLLKNQFTDLGISIGTFVLPRIRELVRFARGVIEAFDNLSDQVKNFVITAALLVAAIGPVVTFTGLFLASLGFIATTIFGAIGVILSLATSLGLLLLPIGLVVASIAGLGIAFVASFKKIDKFAEVTSTTLVQKMGEFGYNIILAFARGMATALTFVVQVLNELGKVIAKWLKPGSPPALLPDLDKWGAGAFTAYMEGWLSADFSVFSRLTSKIESFLRSLTDAADDASRRSLITRILGTRRDIAKAINEVKRFGRVTQATMDAIIDGVSQASQEVRNYVLAVAEVSIVSAKVARAQEEVNRITQEYEEALRPIAERLAEISRRQQEVADANRIRELEEILADPRAPELVRELARLELEEISLEADARELESARDAALSVAEAQLEAAQAQLEAAEEARAQAEGMLDVLIKNNELMREFERTTERATKKLKEGLDAGGISGFDLDSLEIPGFDDAGGLIDDLIEDLEVESIADTISDGFAALVEDLKKEFQPLIDAWNELGDTWAPIFDTLFESVDGVLPTMDDFLGKIDEISEKTQGWAETIAAFAEGGALEFLNIITDIKDLAGLAVDAVSGLFGDDRAFIDPFEEPSDRPAGDAFTDIFEEPGDRAFAPISGLGKLIERVFGDIKETISQTVDDTIAKISAWFKETDIGNFVFITLGGNVANLMALFRTIGLIIEGPLNDAFTKISASLTNALDIVRELWEENETLRTVVIDGAKVIGLIFVGALALLTAVIAGVINAIARGIQFAAEFIAIIIDGGARMFKGIVNSWTGIWRFLQGILQVIWGVITGETNDGIDNILGGLEMFVGGVIDFFVGMLQAITGVFFAGLATVAGIVFGFVDGVIGFFRSLYDVIVGNSYVPDLVNGVIDWFSTMVKDVIKELAKFILDVIDWGLDITDEFFNIVEQVVDTFTDVPKRLFDQGVKIVQGLIDGIQSKVGGVISTVTGMISDATSAIGDFLNLGSPSKLYRDIGQDTVIGFRIGVEKERGALVNTVERLLEPLAGLTLGKLLELPASQQASPRLALQAAPAAPAPTQPASQQVINRTTVDLGGQQINNGVDLLTFTVLIEQAVAEAMGK